MQKEYAIVIIIVIATVITPASDVFTLSLVVLPVWILHEVSIMIVNKPPFCNENPIDCHFEVKSHLVGETVRNDDTNINYLIFCRTGHARISSMLFHDEILCAGEVMFVPRGSEYRGIALSDVTLLVHKFNNTVCQNEKCILAYLYSHRYLRSKIYCSKLTVPKSLQILISGIVSYLTDETHDANLWKLKHKELIWAFTRYYGTEELQSFFHPMTDEQVPFRNLVMTHYRRNWRSFVVTECIHSAGYSRMNSVYPFIGG